MAGGLHLYVGVQTTATGELSAPHKKPLETYGQRNDRDSFYGRSCRHDQSTGRNPKHIGKDSDFGRAAIRFQSPPGRRFCGSGSTWAISIMPELPTRAATSRSRSLGPRAGDFWMAGKETVHGKASIPRIQGQLPADTAAACWWEM
jgi:hypothetical protein